MAIVSVVAALAARTRLGPVAEVTRALAQVVTIYGPALAAAANTARGGGLPAALAVGPVPAVVFWVVATVVDTTGDAPAWALTGVFAAVGVSGAVAGYAIVAGHRLALRRYRAD